MLNNNTANSNSVRELCNTTKKKSFYSLFGMLDFNYINYFPSLFKDYTLSGGLGDKLNHEDGLQKVTPLGIYDSIIQKANLNVNVYSPSVNNENIIDSYLSKSYDSEALDALLHSTSSDVNVQTTRGVKDNNANICMHTCTKEDLVESTDIGLKSDKPRKASYSKISDDP
jgi:hypothetical protein